MSMRAVVLVVWLLSGNCLMEVSGFLVTLRGPRAVVGLHDGILLKCNITEITETIFDIIWRRFPSSSPTRIYSYDIPSQSVKSLATKLTLTHTLKRYPEHISMNLLINNFSSCDEMKYMCSSQGNPSYHEDAKFLVVDTICTGADILVTPTVIDLRSDANNTILCRIPQVEPVPNIQWIRKQEHPGIQALLRSSAKGDRNRYPLKSCLRDLGGMSIGDVYAVYGSGYAPDFHKFKEQHSVPTVLTSGEYELLGSLITIKNNDTCTYEVRQLLTLLKNPMLSGEYTYHCRASGGPLRQPVVGSSYATVVYPPKELSWCSASPVCHGSISAGVGAMVLFLLIVSLTCYCKYKTRTAHPDKTDRELELMNTCEDMRANADYDDERLQRLDCTLNADCEDAKSELAEDVKVKREHLSVLL